jgi:hypothetical protein
MAKSEFLSPVRLSIATSAINRTMADQPSTETQNSIRRSLGEGGCVCHFATFPARQLAFSRRDAEGAEKTAFFLDLRVLCVSARVFPLKT